MPNALDPYIPSPQKPWNRQRVQHLYRRLGFGASKADIDAALALTPSDLVDQLIDGLVNAPAPDPPYWANYTTADYMDDNDLMNQHRYELSIRWLSEMLTDSHRGRLSLFWHNHFVTEENVYGCPSYMWSYFNLLHLHSMGNFRTFVQEVGINPAMLVYLNGNQNIADEPNENYARELMELFTMGESNGYTQADIPQVAKALTGWRADQYDCTPAFFDAGYFDTGNKTIFGQTGAWNFQDVHQIIFTLRKDQVSYYIMRKMYKKFLYQDHDEAVVNTLATTFKDNNFELAPVFRQFFKSEHFFEDKFINAQLKSPFDCFLNLLRQAGLNYPDDVTDDTWGAIAYWCDQLGSDIFNPPNVAGWPGHHAWLNENTLTYRWSFANDLLFGYFSDTAREKLRTLAIDMTNNSNDPVLITSMLVEHFLNTTLLQEHLDIAVLYFKSDIPENYFEDGSWNLYWDEAPYQIVNLLSYLVRLPEYQLG